MNSKVIACNTCGSYVSKDYLRVCGDNDDTVQNCPHCTAAQRSEARRSAAGEEGPSGGEEGADSAKMVFSLDSDADEVATSVGGGRQRAGVHGSRQENGTSGERRAGGRAGSRQDARKGRRGVATADSTSSDGSAGETGAILSTVFDALR